MIFAAGLGTRLKPLTDSIPKALAPVAGHTLLYHVLMRLRDSGIDEFVINVHHFADKVIDYVHGTPELAAMNIKFSDERDLLRNTGGGIRYARPLLGGDHFLIHNLNIKKFNSLIFFSVLTRTSIYTVSCSLFSNSFYFSFCTTLGRRNLCVTLNKCTEEQLFFRLATDTNESIDKRGYIKCNFYLRNFATGKIAIAPISFIDTKHGITLFLNNSLKQWILNHT